MSDGCSKTLRITQASQTPAIDEPWQTSQRDEEGFSVLHEIAFHLPTAFGTGQRITLDLGKVDVMARVTLNGKTLDTLWMPSFELDVTDAFLAVGTLGWRLKRRYRRPVVPLVRVFRLSARWPAPVTSQEKPAAAPQKDAYAG